MPRVIITGGFGCVGGRLGRHLAQAGRWDIVLGTRGAATVPDWLPAAQVLTMPWHSEEKLTEACRGAAAIVHLAGMNAQDCAADPVGALEFNGVTTARLARAATAAGVKRFIHVSTAHVYGSPLAGSITERSATTALHPYATSHRAGEDPVLFMQQRGQIQGIALRMSNSFGAPVRPHANCWTLLVNDLCRQALEMRQLVLQSSGLQRRDFITLTDACRAIAHLLEAESGCLGDGLFNVGGAWSPTVLQMAERIAARCKDEFGFIPPIVHPAALPQEIDAPLDYRIDKLLATGFELRSDVDAEIRDTLRFCASLRTERVPR